MATSTTYLSLIKPELSDTSKIREDFNTNMDTIDGRFSATYMAVQAKNAVTITGGTITGITDLVVADGGTGVSTLTDGGVLLGGGTGAITAMAVLADSEMIVGNGTTDPVAESGATLRTSIGVAIGTNVQAYDAALTSISGLAYVSASFIKLTANDTYAVRTIAQTKSDLSLNLVENTALSTWAGTTNITTLGTVTTGTLSTGAVLADVTMTLGSDADNDVYYRSSSKLARLAVNATATNKFLRTVSSGAPTWATLVAGDMPTTIDAIKIANGTVTNTEYQYINSLSSNAQTQLTLASDKIDYADSPMIVTGGVVSEGTNAGTFKVTALTALLRATDGSATTGVLTYATLAEQDNQAITAADTTYYVILNYNSGSPTITTNTSAPNGTQNIYIGKVMKDGSNNVHFINGGHKLQDGVAKLHTRAKTLREIELLSGNAIEYSGTNNFTMTTGIVYAGINRQTQASYNSASTTFTPVYQASPSGWDEDDTPLNVIDFAHYDDDSGTLANVGVGRYGCHWVYRHIDDSHVFVLYGRGSYKLAEAVTALEPTKPTHLADFGCLIGCIIAPQAGGSFTLVQMVTDTFFTGTAVSDHANLSNLDYASAAHTGFATSGANTNITSVLNTALYVGRDADNTINFATDNVIIFQTNGAEAARFGSTGELDMGNNTVGFTQQTVTYNGTTTTVDWKLGNKAIMTFGAGNITTFAFTNPTNPCNLLLKIVQDGSGSRTVTNWDTDIKYPDGTDPTLSTGANAVDIISYYWDGTNYHGVISKAFSVPA